MRNRFLLLLALLPGVFTLAGAAPPPVDAAQTLKLVRAWVHGQYTNKAQFESDLARKLPPEQIHRQLHQFFAPLTVEIPGIDGYLVYQHASVDGSFSPPSLIRIGLLQFFTDPQTGKLVQRELNFKDGERWKNAYQKPELLQQISMADFEVKPGCDFVLSANAAGTEVSGVMQERACTLYSEGLKTMLYARDAVIIRPDEYQFWGQFVDDSGAVRWGTESTEYYRMFRVSGAP
ncbi:MAG: CpcT/CpeT family chromophore lyase [Gammaproteobacteria bacterium]